MEFWCATGLFLDCGVAVLGGGIDYSREHGAFNRNNHEKSIKMMEHGKLQTGFFPPKFSWQSQLDRKNHPKELICGERKLYRCHQIRQNSRRTWAFQREIIALFLVFQPWSSSDISFWVLRRNPTVQHNWLHRQLPNWGIHCWGCRHICSLGGGKLPISLSSGDIDINDR